MKEASLVTGKVFTKLFFSFVVVLFVGMVVLDFSLRQVMEQSLRSQAEESLVAEARLLAAHIEGSGTSGSDSSSLQQVARLDAFATGGAVTIFNGQGALVASSEDSPKAEGPLPVEVATVLSQRSNQHDVIGRDRRGHPLCSRSLRCAGGAAGLLA